MSGTRTANMQKRRERILAEARAVITGPGYDSLNTRSLAKAAGVTVPTLYNLIGNKEEIMRVLMMESIDRIEERLHDFDHTGPLEMAEAIIFQSAALFAEDEMYYQSAAISADRAASDSGAHTGWQQLTRRAEQMAARACAAALEQGLLRGNIPTADLARQFFICYSGPMRDWTYNVISLEEFKKRVLCGFYICLAADAKDGFRQLLIRKFQKINGEAGAVSPHSRRAIRSA